MRTAAFLAALLVVMSSTGCFWRHHKQQPPPAVTGASHPATNAPPSTNTFIVTPEEGPNGRVSSVNASLRFVVLTFPLGQVPPADTHLGVFRNGANVGELKITGPRQDDNTVADIMAGDAQVGDEVRQK